MNTFLGSLPLLFLLLGGGNGDSVTQTEGQVTLPEGASLTVNCSYESTQYPALLWYVQYPGESPQLLLRATKANEKGSNRGFEALYNKDSSSFHLVKSSVQESDSAMYYCALSPYGNKLVFGSGTTVRVKPYITDPQPAVYQLTDSNAKSSNLSMCLLTDFDSQTNVSQRAESKTVFTSHTVLNMKSLDSKSYGALAWSQNINFSCPGAFSKHKFFSSSDTSCDAKLVEKSFETDMNLNFQNLSVIGLRLLLLKVAGFNLLMTLRLWSS